MITSDLERKINDEYKRLLKIHAQAEVSTDDLKSNMLLDNEVARIITSDDLAIDVCFPDDYKKTIREEAVENVLRELGGLLKIKGDFEKIKRDGKLELLEQLTEYVLRQHDNFAKLCDGADNEHLKDVYYGCEHAFISMTARLKCETEGLLKEGAYNESEQNG